MTDRMSFAHGLHRNQRGMALTSARGPVDPDRRRHRTASRHVSTPLNTRASAGVVQVTTTSTS